MANRDTTVTLLIRANAADLNRALNQAGQRTRTFATEARAAGEQATRGFNQTRGSVEAIGKQLSGVRSQLLTFIGLQSAGSAIAGLAGTTDAYANLTAKIRLATDGHQGFVQAEQAVFDLSQRTSTALDATATLFGRLNSSLREQGAGQQEVLGLTETINQALAVSGATGAEAASAILQLSQAFGAGALRGEEFNAVNEASPRLMQALARNLGVPRGALKELASEGKLTTEVLRAAFSGEEARKIAAEFAQLPLTIERSMTQLGNAFTRFIGQRDQMSGASSAIALAIQALAQNLDTLTNVLGVVAVAALARLVSGLVMAGMAKVQAARQARQLALQELAEARAAETAARAQHTHAQAMASAGLMMGRLSAAEATLAAAQQRTVAATRAASAAISAKTITVRGLSAALGLMGGPLGVAITGITLLAMSFESASKHARQAKEDFEDVIKAARDFQQQQDLDSGVRAGKALIAKRQQLREELENLEREHAQGGAFYGGVGESKGKLLFGAEAEAEIQRVRTQLAMANKEFETTRDAVVQLRAAAHSGARTTHQVSKEAADFNKTLGEQNERLKVERIEREKGLRTALEYQAMKAAGVKEVGELSAATRELIEVQLQERLAAEAASKADKERSKAAKEAASEAKSAAKEQERERKRQEKEALDRRTELEKAVQDAQIGLLRHSGQEAEARRIELVRQYGQVIVELEHLGEQSGPDIIRRLIDVEVAKAQLDELQAQIERVFGEQSRQELSIQTRQQAGLLNELDARRELLDLHARTAAEIEQLLPILEEAARLTGDPAAIERVKDLTLQVAALKVQTNELVRALSEGFERGLSTALEGLATGTMTVREALVGLVQDITRALAQMVAQQMAAAATAKLISTFGGKNTPNLAQPDPAQAAAAGMAYATPISGAAVALGTAGTLVMSAAQAMQAAATTMIVANSMQVSGGGFSGGGFTGMGPKFAPAGVVHRGEFVHRREVVRQPGARVFLERFNRIGMTALENLRGYASGGFVSAAPALSPSPRSPMVERPTSKADSTASSGQITNVLYLDPREVVNVMGTQAGRQIILSTIRANAPTVRQDLST